MSCLQADKRVTGTFGAENMMNEKDPLGDRMKGYEAVPRTRLVRRVPVMARIDGRAFHTITRKMDKPYDSRFQECMWAAAAALCEDVQGCQVAYVQSDEISLLITDWQSESTQPWFDYDLQKMCSIAAGIASSAFLDQYRKHFGSNGALPHFDARFWNLPQNEVVNCFVWRQQDAVRNSIQSLAHAHFSEKQLHGVNTAAMQDMLFREKSINWNDCPTEQKRGVCVVQRLYQRPMRDVIGSEKASALQSKGVTLELDKIVERWEWELDANIPIFTQDRNYIGDLLAAFDG